MDISREADAFTDVALFDEPTVGPLTEAERPVLVKTVYTSANQPGLAPYLSVFIAVEFVTEDGACD